jgi:hypothetical protein
MSNTRMGSMLIICFVSLISVMEHEVHLESGLLMTAALSKNLHLKIWKLEFEQELAMWIIDD